MTALLLDPVRPTIKCLRQDLGYRKLPPATELLHELDLPILKKAQEICRSHPPMSDRIASIDDEVLWKVKIARWRGAVWCDLPARWLVAAGRREEGAPEDFYEALAESGRRRRAEHNKTAAHPIMTDTLVTALLPGEDDRDRIVLERAVVLEREVRTVVRELVLAAARSSSEHSDEAGGCSIAVRVRRTEPDEVYVGIKIVGPVQPTITAVILDSVPAVADREGWFLDTMPDRADEPGELVWSNLLDAPTLDQLLEGS